MIREVADRASMLEVLDAVRAELDSGSVEQGVADPTAAADLDPPITEAAVEATIDMIDASVAPGGTTRSARRDGRTEEEGEDGPVYLPHDPVVALTQSLVERCIDTRRPDLLVGPEERGDDRRNAAVEGFTARSIGTLGPSGRRLFGAFEPADYGWISAGLVHAARRLRGKHEFNATPAPPCRLGDASRLILIGDWGSGIERARTVAAQVRRHVEDGLRSSLDTHVIHLGDVYYSGFGWEYEKRLLDPWPVSPDMSSAVGSWCLNGNHDMYSGGHGYFGTVLRDPRFARQGRSSWFTLEHRSWRIVGLDTAWDESGLWDDRADRGLVAPQAERVAAWASEDDRPLVLLTHHPLFGKGKVDEHLERELAGPLGAGRIRGWFWGHEHRAVAYEPAEGVEYPRCLGHGGVPVYTFQAGMHRRASGELWREEGRLPGSLEPWAMLGYAVVDLTPQRLQVRYYNELGEPSPFEDDWTVGP